MAILKRHKSIIIGLTDDLNQINQAITDETTARQTADGDLSLLNTTNKTSLVQAINEVNTAASTGSSESLKIANNLSDVADVPTARTNLNVYSTTEVDDAITAAELSLGTNYNVATIVERDALTNLDTADRVFVTDDGDTKWAMYKPGAVDVNGVATSWIKLSDQDALENSINAASIKTTYESNPDTNAYTDAAKAKVDFLAVTAAINLDDAVLKAELIQDLEVSAPADQAPSSAAVKAYADEEARTGGPEVMLESVVVNQSTTATDTIVLTHAPKGGIDGILNFATVRYIDGATGAAYDAPLVATVNSNEFTIDLDTSGQWDGNTVQVQYLYVAPIA